MDGTARRGAHPARARRHHGNGRRRSAASSDSSRANEEVPLFVFDAGYNPIAIGHDLAEERCECLTRIRDDRVFYADPPRSPQPTDREPVDVPHATGRRFKCSDPKYLGATRRRASSPLTPAMAPSRCRPGTVCTLGLIGRGRWRDYGGAPPIVRGTVIRVDVEHLPKPTSRTKKTLWLFWSGPGEPDLERCWRAYLRRFDIEHTFRFIKNTLGWTTPSLCTPEQADRWSWLIVAAYTQLRLARGLVDDLRLPWERPLEPERSSRPARVRRGFRRLRATIGTPASPPKSTTPGPGRPKGTRKPPRTRYPAVKKAA